MVVDGKDESEHSVRWQDFFRGHVVGECAACSPAFASGAGGPDLTRLSVLVWGWGRGAIEELLLFVPWELSKFGSRNTHTGRCGCFQHVGPAGCFGDYNEYPLGW